MLGRASAAVETEMASSAPTTASHPADDCSAVVGACASSGWHQLGALGLVVGDTPDAGAGNTLMVSEEGGKNLRKLFVAPGAQLRIYECESALSAGDGDITVPRVVTEVELAANASLQWVRIFDGVREVADLSAGAHADVVKVVQEAGSSLDITVVELGAARTTARQTEIVLDGEQASANWSGLRVVGGNGRGAHEVKVSHRRPNSTSNVRGRAVVGGRAVSEFVSMALVRREAQLTRAHQDNRNLLLSRAAVARTSPQMEIYADDVKCGHGATVGELDPEQVFYLRARGLSLEAARRELTIGFCSEVVLGIGDSDVREGTMKHGREAVVGRLG